MKPYTLAWWLTWKEYCLEMLVTLDDATDDCSANPEEYTDRQKQFLWDEWGRFKELHEYIKQRIIDKYGE